MNSYEKLFSARSPDRPTAVKYIENIIDRRTELHGDRCFGDDPAMLGGIGEIDGVAVTYIGIERGQNTEDRITRNFGSPNPEGYRKARRLMAQAEKFNRPVICFVDTAGAFCGEEAEARGQGEAIAANLLYMQTMKTPVISIIIGEGGSGGALGIAVANRVYMLKNSVYSVISAEGCAEILLKDTSRANETAENLKITAEDIVSFSAADGIFDEDFDNFGEMCEKIKTQLLADIREFSEFTKDEIRSQRYEKFRKIGIYSEE